MLALGDYLLPVTLLMVEIPAYPQAAFPAKPQQGHAGDTHAPFFPSVKAAQFTVSVFKLMTANLRSTITNYFLSALGYILT